MLTHNEYIKNLTTVSISLIHMIKVSRTIPLRMVLCKNVDIYEI